MNDEPPHYLKNKLKDRLRERYPEFANEDPWIEYSKENGKYHAKVTYGMGKQSFISLFELIPKRTDLGSENVWVDYRDGYDYSIQ